MEFSHFMYGHFLHKHIQFFKLRRFIVIKFFVGLWTDLLIKTDAISCYHWEVGESSTTEATNFTLLPGRGTDFFPHLSYFTFNNKEAFGTCSKERQAGLCPFGKKVVLGDLLPSLSFRPGCSVLENGPNHVVLIVARSLLVVLLLAAFQWATWERRQIELRENAKKHLTYPKS